MFDKINLTCTTSKVPLTSKNLSEQALNNPKYNPENLINSEFYITGSVDSFSNPPITDLAYKNLYHMQSFNIFHYGKESFTKRQNFHSFLILYTYSGKGILEYNGKTYHLAKEDGFFIDCMKSHLYKVDGDSWDTAILHIGGPLLPQIYEQYENNGSIVFHQSFSDQLQLYLEQLLGLYNSPSLYRDWQASNCISNMLTHLLLFNSETLSKKNYIPKNIQQLMKYMENNYTNHISLDSLAEFSNINKFHLSKEFKRYTGFSPNDYLITLRINHAKTLLKTTTLPAIKIAHEVGIHDVNNFNNLFKKKVNKTPIQYRNSTDFIS